MNIKEVNRKLRLPYEGLDIFNAFRGNRNPNSVDIWNGSDSKDNFLNNANEDKMAYWKDKSIEYKFNNLGFRSDVDFHPKDHGAVFLGCSFTEGVGLPLEYTWGYHMSKYLDEPFFNLGIGGKGIHAAYRNLVNAHNYGLIFDKVFLFAPPFYRYEFIMSDNKLFKYYLSENVQNEAIFTTMHNMMGEYWTPEMQQNGSVEFLTSFLFGSHQQALVESIRTIFAIDSFAQSVGAKLYFLSHEYYFAKDQHARANGIPDSVVPRVPARDGHWSSKMQYMIFNDFLEEYPELKNKEALKEKKTETKKTTNTKVSKNDPKLL